MKLNKAKKVSDARLKIISKNRSKVRDARDQLVKLAKTTDARRKLEKIRNLKQGKLEVKKTSKGGITITTTTKGQVLLTTRKKEQKRQGPMGAKKSPMSVANARVAAGSGRSPATVAVASLRTKNIGSLTQTVGKGGKVSIRTKKTGTPLTTPTTMTRPAAKVRKDRVNKTAASSKKPGRLPPSSAPLTRTIKGEMSEAARLDYELMNTNVDPVIIKRTVRQNVRERSLSPLDDRRSRILLPSRRSPEPDYYDSRSRSNRLKTPLTTSRGRQLTRDRARSPLERREHSRSRSPIDLYEERAFRTGGRLSSSSALRSRYDYDDQRLEEDTRRNSRRSVKQDENRMYSSGVTRSLYPDSTSGGYVSPLQGSKVIVSNLQNTVTQEDIVELFGDIGNLRRAKILTPGTAEVVFVHRYDALKAVEIYHNRQLDGKAMRCQIMESSSNNIAADNDGIHQEERKRPDRVPLPELDVVHRALFN